MTDKSRHDMVDADSAAVEAAHFFAAARAHDDAAASGERDHWLAQSDLNRDAYSSAQSLWADLGEVAARFKDVGPIDLANVTPLPAYVASTKQRHFSPLTGLAIAATLLLFLSATVMLLLRPSGSTLATDIGRQEVAALEDGTRVTLNTDTELSVTFSRSERVVHFSRGEALFDVAHDTDRPFLVKVGDRTVRAVGTSFVIRSDPTRQSVTLLQGRVAVSQNDGRGGREVMLVPGQRLTVQNQAVAKIDWPQIASIMAWRDGRLVLASTPLAEAIAEMNRYTRTPVVLEDPGAASKHITGTFRVAKSEDFARSVAAIYQLRVEKRSNSYVLLPAEKKIDPN